jgi:membrane-associated phospholipid phosphatase
MGEYQKLISNFLKENRSKGVADYIAKGGLLLYALLLFSTPLSTGKLPVLTPEQIVFLFLAYAVFVGKGMGFLRDIAPLLILFFAYEAMRGVIVESDESVLIQYWTSIQSMNGLIVNATPSMANLGDAITINVMNPGGSVKHVNMFVARVGEEFNTTKAINLTLEGGSSEYFVNESKSSKFFDEGSGAYNITAFASGDVSINGSSVVGITRNVHYREPLLLEKAVFGFIPSEYLQELLYRDGQVSFVDIISVLAYCMHFLIPFGFACLLWFKDRNLYKVYSASFLVLTYAGLITFLLYPAAPPWLASLVGYTNGIKKIYNETSKILNLVILPTLYYWINANTVAAIPSLHAAYPVLVAIFSVRLWSKKGWLVSLYPLATALSLVYLGEHYLIDVLMGVIYTLAALFFVEWIFNREKGKPADKRSYRGKKKKG